MLSIKNLKQNYDIKAEKFKELMNAKLNERKNSTSSSKEWKNYNFRSKTEEKERISQAIIKKYQEKTQQAIQYTEENLCSYWKRRINDLLELLKHKEALKYKEPLENDEEIKKLHENSFRERLSESENLVYFELNEKYRNKFLSQIQEIREKNKEKNIQNINFLIKEIEMQQYTIIQKQKHLLQEEYFETNYFKNHSFPELDQEKLKIKEQANIEVKETIDDVKNELDKALLIKYKEIDEEIYQSVIKSLDNVKPLWDEEMKEENLFNSNNERIIAIQSEITDKIKEELSAKIYSGVLLKKNIIYEEINSDFMNTHEEFRKKTEEKTYKKIDEIEAVFQDNFFKVINSIVEKQLRPIEIKIKMNYHKRLSNSKDDIKKDLEAKFSAQFTVRKI